MWRMRDGDDGDTVCGEAEAFISISTSVCQMSESLMRRSGALQYVSSQQGVGFESEFHYSAHKKKWILTVPGERDKFWFLGANVSLRFKDSTQQICLLVVHAEPDSATAASARGGTVLKTSAIFMFPFLRFAVLFLLWLGWPSTLGLTITEAKGLPT